MADAGEPLKYQTWVLKVSIHCEGCKKKVKKIIHGMKDIYTVEVDLQQNKVTVVGNVDSDNLIKRLHKYGKRAELVTPIPTAGMDKKQPQAAELPAQVPAGVEEKQQAAAGLSPQISVGVDTKQPAPPATVLPQTQESTSLEKNINVSALAGKSSASPFPVPPKKHPGEKKNEATAKTKNGPEKKVNVNDESSMNEAATRPGNPKVIPAGIKAVIAGNTDRKGKQPAGTTAAAAVDQAKINEVNKGEAKRPVGEETSKAAKVTAGDAASPADSCNYPVHLQAHQPIYTMSHHTAQPSSSYPVNYTLPSGSTYAYASGYAPPEQLTTWAPLETFSGAGTPTYYMFNDENANSCSLM